MAGIHNLAFLISAERTFHGAYLPYHNNLLYQQFVYMSSIFYVYLFTLENFGNFG